MTIPAGLYEDLKPHLEKIEQVRRPYLWLRQIGIALIATFLGIVLIVFMLPNLLFSFGSHNEKDLDAQLINMSQYFKVFDTLGVYMTYLLPTALLMLFINQFFNFRITSTQEKIFISIVHQAFPQLNFSKKTVTKEQIMPSGFFLNEENTLTNLQLSPLQVISKCTVEGKIDDITVEFADINVISSKGQALMFIPMIGVIIGYAFFLAVHLKNLFGKRRDAYMYGFKGLFFEADFYKKFKGLTVILPDNFEKKIGFLAKSVQELKKNQGKLIYLEDPRFEKEFVVYSNDEIEARTILSFRFMEKIVELKKKFDRPLFISFSGTKVYVSVLDPEGLFEVPLRKNVLNLQGVEKIYNNLKICTEIIKDLQLKEVLLNMSLEESEIPKNMFQKDKLTLEIVEKAIHGNS